MRGDADIREFKKNHAKLMVPVIGALAVLGLIWEPEMTTQITILLFGVGTVGLAHGAMDHRVGEILIRPKFGRAWPIVFTVAYLVFVAVGLAGWVVAPVAALAGFILYSTFHFGSDPSRESGLIFVVSRGALPFLLPIAIHPGEVARLFSLVATADIQLEQYAIPVAILTVIFLIATLTAAARSRNYVHAIETVLLVALNVTNPPLIAFGCYFVLLHSLGHMIELCGWLEPSSPLKGFFKVARESVPLTGLVLVSAAVGSTFAAGSGLEPAVLQTVFVTLSSLTLPHMVVTHFAERHFKRAEAR